MPKSFYIIDGHAHIYRAYFAPFRDLVGPNGEPTKATFVFTQRLLNLIDQRKPDYLAMVIDAGDESVFRKEIYPEYKANRKSRPDDFLPQEQRILSLVKDVGVPIFVKRGYEADDLIATMAAKLCGQDFDVYMVSSDKDLRQVVNDCTKMYDAYTNEVIDAARLEEKYGFNPREALEIQTLMGDNIDNIPGIPGVGDKTALKLIKQYGSADNVLAHVGELKGKMKENFEKFADRIPVARKLVTLKTDVEFDFDPEVCRFRGLDVDALRKHLAECGFHSLLKKYETAESTKSFGREMKVTAPPAPKKPAGLFSESLFGDDEQEEEATEEQDAGEALPPGVETSEGLQYTLINTDELFDDFLKELKKQPRFAFDTETDSLSPISANLVGISISWQAGTGYYIPVRCPEGAMAISCDRALAGLKPILEDAQVKKVGHNIKFDMLVMRSAGIELRGVEMDSMVATFLVDASRMQYGIDALALQYLNFKKVATVELLGKKGKNQLSMDRVALDKITRYAAEDADIALRLADHMKVRLDAVPALRKLNDDVETPLIDVLAEMEFNGVAIDPQILKEQSEVLGARAEALHSRIIEEAGVGDFNPDSTKQLADVLFRKLNLRVIKRGKTGPSTDVEVLEKLADLHVVPKLILEYRSLVKLKNTYLDNLTSYLDPKTQRIHGSFNQTGAATGRLSMSDPNLQNIPIRTDEGRRIRLAFVPSDPERNVLLAADYSQIELRLLAHFTQEPALLRAFEADEDVHRTVASEVFHVPLDQVTKDQRGQAKTINFGIIYGVSAFGLARRIEGLDQRGAQELINAYNKRFPSIKRFLEECVMQAQSFGFVETILGRRRPLPDISSGVIALRNAAERMAINSVVQGSAADLIKIAMVNVFRRMKKENSRSKLLLQVHDELVFETPAELAEREAVWIREEMTNAMKLKAPLKVEINWGKNWQEGK
jgi:DNA polymerase-1